METGLVLYTSNPGIKSAHRSIDRDSSLKTKVPSSEVMLKILGLSVRYYTNWNEFLFPKGIT